MKSEAEVLGSEPLLTDRSAHTFGTDGERFNVRSNGVLTLTGDRLLFEHALTGVRVEIPVAEIESVSLGVWHRRPRRPENLLRILYRGNLLFAVAVARPQAWLNAIEHLTLPPDRRTPVVRRAPVHREIPRVRLIVVLVLLFVALLTVVLPLFFTWMHTRTVREVGGEAPPQSTGTTG